MTESAGGIDQLTVTDELRDAVERSGDDAAPTLILVESGDGLAGPVVELIPDRLRPLQRAVGALATQAKVGCVAEILDLDVLAGGAVVIEEAQWVDATSMGRLQRLISFRDGALLVVVAHRPVPPEDSWWLNQLAAAGERHGRVLTTRVDQRRGTPIEAPTDPSERDLVVAAGLVSDPIPVPVLARLLGVSESSALESAESLVQRELLIQDRSGFLASPAARAVEAGEARLGHVAGRLAAAFEDSGGHPAVVGSLYLTAGNHVAAYPHLLDAAMTAQRAEVGEAYHLAVSALMAAEAASLGTKTELGELHLACGRHLRAAGRSQAAADHLDDAVTLLSGPLRIDALGFAAAVADDMQKPQEAERILAVAEWEAVTHGEPAKLGSIGTFRARALNRLGFAAESDALLAKATAILAEHATPTQQFYAEVNRAWILFDRGQAAEAEAAFTHLRDRTESHDLAGLADKEAWRSRALFAIGRPQEALEAVERARDFATRGAVEAPLFLADLALAEGNLLFGRPGDALEAVDRVMDLVERQLPAWTNLARSNRALALLRLGEIEEAESEIETALAATPAGADGWRLRSRCRAIQMEIAAGGGTPLPQREAEDLADTFLQGELYGWAAELLCVIAEQGNDAEAAREAMALAAQVGNPMLAARAADAGRLWNESAAASTIRGIRAVGERLPDGWEEEWMAVPSVADALDAPEPAPDDTGEDSLEVLENALRRAGLSADTILSPAQRRSSGLVRHRRRRRSPLTMVAAALGVIAVAGVTSFVVAQALDSDEPPATVVVENNPTTIAEPLTLEETEIEVPVDRLFGTALDRGDPGRSGFVDVAGPRTVEGHYWVFGAADAILATPIAYGNNLLVGSTDGTFQAIDLTRGQSVWSMVAEGQIATSASLGTASLGEGGSAGLAVMVADDGVVRSRDAVTVEEAEQWNTRLGSRIRSSPVVDGEMVFVATIEGRVFGLDLATGEVSWTYPEDEVEALGPITAGLALDNGIIYVGTEQGGLHLVNTDGTLHCEADLGDSIRVNPVVVEGRAYIAAGRVLRILPAGVCETLVSESVQYLSESVIDVAPAVVGDLMYIPNGIFLNAIDRAAVEEGVSDPADVHHWSPGQVHADGKIASAPVVTQDAVYFGTESGWVYAVDSDTGELLWEWRTGNYVRASPVVIQGAVYIASGDGNVYAVGASG